MPEKIVSKALYYIPVRLSSPLCISNGSSNVTDTDVLRDRNGIPFVPGSSLAGAFRSYCKDIYPEIDEKLFSDKRLSPLCISDLTFDERTVTTSIRDGVQLEDRIAKDGSKYDYEVIDAGARGAFRLELTRRENDRYDEFIEKLLAGVNNGDISFGYKKNRGLGQFRLENIGVKFFDFEKGKNTVAAWLDFNQDNSSEYESLELKETSDPEKLRYITIREPLALPGGVCIRRYSAQLGEADYSQLTIRSKSGKEEAVVPGSSWSGAFRSGASRILKQLYKELKPEWTYKKIIEAADNIIQEAFGDVKTGQSKIRISESVIKGAEPKIRTRLKVDRFTGSGVEGALFTERSFYGGKTQLEIKIANENKWMVGLIILVLKDLELGNLPVGGGASIGRGFFQPSGERTIDSGIRESEYRLALLQKIKDDIKDEH